MTDVGDSPPPGETAGGPGPLVDPAVIVAGGLVGVARGVVALGGEEAFLSRRKESSVY